MASLRSMPIALCVPMVVLCQTPDEQKPFDIPPLQTGTFEVGISAGFSRGDVGGTRASLPGFIDYRATGNGGASGKLHLGIGIRPRLQFVVEGAALSGGRNKDSIGGGYRVETSTLALIYDACVHVRLPVNSLFVPYVAGGVASIQSRADVLVVFENPGASGQGLVSASTRVRQKEGAFAPVAGIGFLRFAGGKRFGFRVEAKSFYPLGTSRVPFVQVTAGIVTWLH